LPPTAPTDASTRSQIPSTEPIILSEDEIDEARQAIFQKILNGTDNLEVQHPHYTDAVQWLAKYDKTKATLDQFENFGDQDIAQLKERFSLVLLYYTTGEKLNKTANFLSSGHVCDDDGGNQWNQDGIGAFCLNDGKLVTDLKLGKLLYCFVKVASHHVLIDRTFHRSQAKPQGNSPHRDKFPFKSEKARVERQQPIPLPVESDNG
jgi:hypothetical protein